MSSVTMDLADLLLDDLLAGQPESRLPTDNDLRLGVEAAANVEDPRRDQFPLRNVLASVVLESLLADLVKRERDLTASGHLILHPVHLVELVHRQDDGRLQRVIAAPLIQGEDVEVAVPLSDPLDVPVLFLLRGRPLRDRVRLLTELVRVFRDLVRFGGLPEGVRGDAIRGLGFLSGLLREAAAALRVEETESTEDDGDNHPNRRGDVSKHGSPPVETRDVVTHGAQVDDTVGEPPDAAAAPSSAAAASGRGQS